MAAGGIVEIDLHGKNSYQAKVTIDAALRRARAGTYRLRIVHGYNSGTALRDMVRQEYAGRVLRVVALDQGRTDLVLREFLEVACYGIEDRADPDARYGGQRGKYPLRL